MKEKTYSNMSNTPIIMNYKAYNIWCTRCRQVISWMAMQVCIWLTMPVYNWNAKYFYTAMIFLKRISNKIYNIWPKMCLRTFWKETNYKGPSEIRIHDLQIRTINICKLVISLQKYISHVIKNTVFVYLIFD